MGWSASHLTVAVWRVVSSIKRLLCHPAYLRNKKYGMTCPLWWNNWQVTIDPNSGYAHPISRSSIWVWISLRHSTAVDFALNTLTILNNRDLVVIAFPLYQNTFSKKSCVILKVTWEWLSPLLRIEAKTVAWTWPDRHLTVSVSQCCYICSAFQRNNI
jgi:hypothetical protein